MSTSTHHRRLSALHRFFLDEGGDSAVQYALVASLVSVFLLAAYVAVGKAQVTAFGALSTAVDSAIESGD